MLPVYSRMLHLRHVTKSPYSVNNCQSKWRELESCEEIIPLLAGHFIADASNVTLQITSSRSLVEQSGSVGYLRALDMTEMEVRTAILYGHIQDFITVSKNPRHHAPVKHVDIKHHFIEEEVKSAPIDLIYFPMAFQTTGGPAKAMLRDKFERFVAGVGCMMRTRTSLS